MMVRSMRGSRDLDDILHGSIARRTREDVAVVITSPSGYAPVEDVVEIPATPHATDHHAEVSDSEEQPLSLEEAERSLIQAALIRHDGRRRRAAQDLKISERTLYRKIKEYGLEE